MEVTATTVENQQTVTVARAYAILEIARRAGVSADFFRSWQFERDHKWTVVRVGAAISQQIRFPNFCPGNQEGLLPLQRRVTRAHWAFSPDQTVSRWVP